MKAISKDRMRMKLSILIAISFLLINCSQNQPVNSSSNSCTHYLTFHTKNNTVNSAFRIAIGDLYTNIQDYKIPVEDTIGPVIMAGLEYDSPWTRDATINSWNIGSFIVPEVAKNTLMSRVSLINDSLIIMDKDNYWDAIIWCTGAWNHYLCTGDKDFLKKAYEVTRNTIQFYEKTEFNEKYNLFRGLAWSDGVSAYEGKYAQTGGSSAAIDWVKSNPEKKAKRGFGIPMMATSTNCLYYHSYIVADKMEKELKLESSGYVEKAKRIKSAINKYLWNEETGLYKFYFDDDEESNLETAYGDALAIIFGIADDKQAELIFKNQYVTPAGVPCGWPPLIRYHPDSMTFGRHNALVWPQIQGFWVEAAAKCRKEEALWHDFYRLAKHANRDRQFAEIYHPVTGEMYGGIQDYQGKIISWHATERQTWAATAYIRMIIFGLVGINMDESSISFSPFLPQNLNGLKLSNLKYRGMNLNIEIIGSGYNVKKIVIDGEVKQSASLCNGLKDNHIVQIYL